MILKSLDPRKLVESFLDQDFTVCYVDRDEDRRSLVRGLGCHKSLVSVLGGDFPGTGLHYNVLVIVNEHEMDPKIVKELNCIPGVVGGKSPCVVRVIV